MNLRPYQASAINDLMAWFADNPTGHPCLAMPTGSGKSVVIAELCRIAIDQWPDTRILMLTHVKELIRQNANKLLEVWPDAPLGIYSAGLNSRQIDQITYAGIQSVRNRAGELWKKNLIIIDEAHTISNANAGTYRRLIADLTVLNPAVRCIGLTASPYRLGQGMLTDGDDALFTDIIEPVSIRQLVDDGYLSPLRSKATESRLSADGVKCRGGEFIAGQLERAVNVAETNREVVAEIISRSDGRRAWMVFCAGVAHCEAVAAEMRSAGVAAESVVGSTPKDERDDLIERFKCGDIRCLVSVGVLTTGFDYPDVDLIAMLRPTMSPGLYLQICGRGMRLKTTAPDCLVLDFAGNIERHGPVTDIVPPSPRKGTGAAPVKTCPDCSEIVAAQTRTCPACGYQFPFEEAKKSWTLSEADIMARSDKSLDVTSWRWSVYTSRAGNIMLRCIYYGCLSDMPIAEYFPLSHPRSRVDLYKIMSSAGVSVDGDISERLDVAASELNQSQCPITIKYKTHGKYPRITGRDFAPPEYRRVAR